MGEVAAASRDRVLLRAGTVDDVPALRSLGEAVVPPTYGPIDAAYAQLMLDQWWSVERLAALMAKFPHVVAERDGAVVGMANLGRVSASHRDLSHVDGDREVMWKLYVHPDHQGAGVGSMLLAAVEAMAEGPELWLEIVDGNERAAAFYRARGFEEVERFSDGRWPDDIWWCKRLRTGPDERS